MFKAGYNHSHSQHERLSRTLAHLYSSGDYSDLTITCRGSRFSVHRAIICPQSQFFDRSCKGQFQEAYSRSIDLPEDEPQVVEAMVKFLYQLDYDKRYERSQANISALSQETMPHARGAGADFERPMPADEPLPLEEWPAEQSSDSAASIRLESGLALHSKVYTLAERCWINDLKEVAIEKFKGSLMVAWDIDDFVFAAHEAYMGTVDTDRGLRDVIVRALCDRKGVLAETPVQDMVKELHALAYDMVVHMHSQHRF